MFPLSSTTGQSARHIGKVARLPQQLRDLVNTMLRDGATYQAIIARLREHGVSLLPSNLSRWRKGGHQDWLKERLWLEQMESRLELVIDLLRKNEADRLPQAAQQLTALRIFELLKNLDPIPPQPDPRGVANSVTRAAHAICRLTKESSRGRLQKPPNSPNPLNRFEANQ
jgi:hypothetical protein